MADLSKFPRGVVGRALRDNIASHAVWADLKWIAGHPFWKYEPGKFWSAAPTKTHILNLLHRLVDGKPTDTPAIKAPQALRLTTEPQANVERYDALRKVREARHAS